MYYPEPISKLIDSFTKSPGIGPKTAIRLAFYVKDMNEVDVVDFSKALVNAKRELSYCTICGHITDKEICSVCSDKSIDESVVCVVEDSKYVITMEKMTEYIMTYRVLYAYLS